MASHEKNKLIRKKYIPLPRENNAKGTFYVLKRITRVVIKLGLRDYFIRFFCLGAWLFLKIQNNIKIINSKNIPKKGPFIIVGNHSSPIDALIGVAYIGGIRGRRIYYIANSRDWRKDDIQRYFHELFEGIPRIGSGEELVKVLAGKLIQGKIVGIPPEGMYNKGKIMKGYTGVVRIYHLANLMSKKEIPIIPVAIIGAHVAYPPNVDKDGKYRIKRSGILINVGKPIKLPPINDYDALNYDLLRKETDYIMGVVARLAHQKEGPVESWILKQKQRRNSRQYH
ncbi:MAG: lysophospholipid acyltransferase family protein [Promethearchaeota archaeon]